MTIRNRWMIGLSHGVALAMFLVGLGSLQAEKPRGVFSSAGAAGTEIYGNAQMRGVLVRLGWDVVEPTRGTFDFTLLDRQIEQVEAHGLAWSLAVGAGGVATPAWLIDEVGAPFVSYSFRGQPGYRLPLFWDSRVQDYLGRLAAALGQRYGTRAGLRLVYVPQMTSNGVEGHLQGVDMATLKAAGYTDARWIEAAEATARTWAAAFSAKALAFEVHDVNGGATVPLTIINALWNDPALGQRVGAGMWWISGKTTYQPELVAGLKAFPGDVYGQVIGRSDQTDRFEGGDYASVFAQAKEIGMRYIEPWDYEFRTGTNSANGGWDAEFAAFNQWADATYGSSGGGSTSSPGAGLINLSVRSRVGQGDETLVVGLVLQGAGTKSLLFRGVGPGLASYGVAGYVVDPSLRVWDGAAKEVGFNNDWAGAADLSAVFAGVGAFALAAGSKDAVVYPALPGGAYTAQLQAAGTATGVALVEVYDPAATEESHFVNVAARTRVGVGEDVLVAGFVLGGTAPRTVVVRAIGPALTGYGLAVGAVLANPRLTVFRDATVVAENDDWAGTSVLATTFAKVGAFALPDAGSRDAALLVTLEPGPYTVHVSGVGDTTGIALVEVYLVP